MCKMMAQHNPRVEMTQLSMGIMVCGADVGGSVGAGKVKSLTQAEYWCELSQDNTGELSWLMMESALC